jgi:membrane fusion protein, multidrug efflux system
MTMEADVRKSPLEGSSDASGSPRGALNVSDTNGRNVAAALSEAASARRSGRARRGYTIVALATVVLLGGIGVYYLLTVNQESTDDGQVAADIVPVGMRVAGLVVKVNITENQLVEKGVVLAEIDDADYSAREKEAAAELRTAQAQAAAADAQVQVVEATSKGGLTSARAVVSGSSVGVTSAQAQREAARAALTRAEVDAKKAALDLNRAKELRAANAIPSQNLDNAQAVFDVATAAVAQARAEVALADQTRNAALAQVSEAQGRLSQSAPVDAQIATAHAQADLAHAHVESAKAALDLADLQLSYTKIVAPAEGIASRLTVHPGQLVTVGQPVIELVPTATYVVANFKETQLGRMHAGQKAEISVDTYPGRTFEGRIESISGGTGSSFSLLPADNATGNFVKVVQRVPVRIAWVNFPESTPMRAGLSADVTVRVGQ